MIRTCTTPENSGIVGVLCPNSTYEQKYRCEIAVREVETFLHALIKCRPMKEREIEVAAFEIKIDTVVGEIQVWKGKLG